MGMQATVPTAMREILDAAQRAGIMAPVLAQLQRVRSRPDARNADLARVLALDPLLASQLLKVANSSFYGMSQRVGTLEQTVAVLGFDNGCNLALALVIGARARALGLSARTVWRHCVRTAAAGRLVARYVRSVDPSEALIHGLLHDVGRIALISAIRGYDRIALATTGAEGLAQERELCGTDHVEVGVALLRGWGLPSSVWGVVATHHDEPRSPAQRTLCLAGALADGTAGDWAESGCPLLLTPPQRRIVLEVFEEEAHALAAVAG